MLNSRQKFAFRSVQHWQNLIKSQGSLVNAIVGDSCIHVDQHYPLDDWRSPCTTFQGFYHCHRADGSREHGHIHLFKRFDDFMRTLVKNNRGGGFSDLQQFGLTPFLRW